MRSLPGDFAGTARFEILGRLGAGGMGIVYRALDRERGGEVALKTLSRVSAAAIFQFKQEFRALADVAHANLVTLHELFCEDGRWFFTMELVDGVDLLTYVCGRPVEVHSDPSHVTLDDDGAVVDAPRRARPLLARLREALPQLATGLCALHDSGHLHRDIKPSNVLVTPSGRVVILDFGVIAALGSRDTGGTPAYMAPEQVQGLPATPASDWYSVGVVLYYALAGRLPFTGSSAQILWDKVHGQPAPLKLSRPETPEDLEQLCDELLRSDPEARPSGRAILGRLGGAERRSIQIATSRATTDAAAEPELVGREPHLARLRDALAQSRRGGGMVALVHGVSGMGKSALVRAFVDEARRDANALVFAGRCYERESVPYKAIDTVIDALCEHLLALPERQLAAALPPDAALLATLFPVLRRIPTLADIPVELARRPQRLRQRAFAALRDLFARIAERDPVIVLIDDLQWGDADSAPLLDALMRAPNAPAILLLGCYRSDETARSPLLQTWFRDARPDVVSIAVEALAPADALAIAAKAFRGEGVDPALAGAVALESGGSPFFLHELVRFVAAARSADIPSLDDVIRSRIDRLGIEARRLVELLAVAARPVEQRVAQAAADIAEPHWAVLIQRVATARVVRVSGRRGDDLVECYHDRIRETVAAALGEPEAARIHRRLAYALQQNYRCDPEIVAHHFEAAGDIEHAAHYALQAADLAAAALAFDRAVALFRRALALYARVPRPDSVLVGAVDEPVVRLKLAAALVNAGRGAEAAHLYLEAAAAAEGARALELRRAAAEQLLRSGHVDDGLVVLREVLAAVGMSLPRSATRSIPSLLWQRLRLRLRGLAPAQSPRTDVFTRLDVARGAMLGLALFDPVRSATFSTQHVRLALQSGDPHRISFALALEAGYMASARDPRRATQLLARAEAIAIPLGHPLLHGCVAVIRAIMTYEQGDFRGAFEGCEQAEALIRDHLTGTAWELRTVQLFSVHCLFFLGELAELVRRTDHYIADARDRGDLYAIMNMRSLEAVQVVMHDESDSVRARLAAIETEFPSSGFYLQHMFWLYARVLLELYVGEPERAYRLMMDQLPRVKSSLLLHDRSVRGFFTYLRAAAAANIAHAQPPAQRSRMTRIVLRAARSLARDGAIPYIAMSHQLVGAVAYLRGDAARARRELELAATTFDRAEMKLFAALTRRRLGKLIGGDAGDVLIRDADALLARHQVASPTRGARCLAPGFPDP